MCGITYGLRLASGVGNYAARVYASNREEAARRHAGLCDAHRNPLADEFQQAKKQLEGLERYLTAYRARRLVTRPAD